MAPRLDCPIGVAGFCDPLLVGGGVGAAFYGLSEARWVDTGVVAVDL